MNFEELVRQRRSVRRFEDRSLPPEMVDTLLEAAQWAPSGGNLQPWHFYVVEEASVREQMVDVAKGQTFVAEAPMIIVVCADPDRSAERYHERGRTLFCLQDTAAAVQNVLLAAVHLGLGACWIGLFDEEECSQVLSLPPHLRPVAMIPVGFPAQQPRVRPRRPIEEIVTRV